MPASHGFTYVERSNGEVVISHHGKTATTLRGRRVVRFLEAITEGDPQAVVARATGNYKRGNERG